jgi:REP element-mobilizing transposase RayT
MEGTTEQLLLPFRAGWGGARPGAGRKRKAERSCTPHRARPAHRAAQPVHVTLRAALRPLRSRFLFPSVRLAIARANARAPGQFRVVEFSVQADHIHLLVEAANKRALSAGVRSVSIRVARYVNDLLNRRGPLWADRWHGRALRSPREVRNALVYVLGNFRKHRRRLLGAGLDPYSSAPWFEGFRSARGSGLRAAPFAERPPPGWDVLPLPVSRARTWLLTAGWRRRGLLGVAEMPQS